MLRIIYTMYDSVKCCVRHCGSYSDYFEVLVELNEILSPILFSLFIEDLEIYLQGKPSSGVNIKDINLLLLLFGDDMIILGETSEDLNELCKYCDKWGLEVNTVKTKVVVFRRKDGLHPNESWWFNGTVLETVTDFNYLGVGLIIWDHLL